jgi:SAM-dependent methyltransferase
VGAGAARTYWDEVALGDDALPRGWRRRARTEHLELLRRWVGAPEGRWLKTDLFEERQEDRALLPHLGPATWFGTDLSPAVARHGGARSAAADVRRLPFPDATFDGILSTSTLDHFDDVSEIDRSLVELRRVLRPGASLLLTLDNPRNPLIRLRNALPPGVARRTGLVPFSVGATLDATEGQGRLRAAGFEVVAVEHLLHAPHVVGTRLAAWGWYERRVLPRFARLARTRAAPWTGHFVAFHARRTAPGH